jgi:hypothetical protein
MKHVLLDIVCLNRRRGKITFFSKPFPKYGLLQLFSKKRQVLFQIFEKREISLKSHEFRSEEIVTDTPWPPNMVQVAFHGRNTARGVH